MCPRGDVQVQVHQGRRSRRRSSSGPGSARWSMRLESPSGSFQVHVRPVERVADASGCPRRRRPSGGTPERIRTPRRPRSRTPPPAARHDAQRPCGRSTDWTTLSFPVAATTPDTVRLKPEALRADRQPGRGVLQPADGLAAASRGAGPTTYRPEISGTRIAGIVTPPALAAAVLHPREARGHLDGRPRGRGTRSGPARPPRSTPAASRPGGPSAGPGRSSTRTR